MISNLYDAGKGFGKGLFLTGLLLYQLGCDLDVYNQRPIEPVSQKKPKTSQVQSKTKPKQPEKQVKPRVKQEKQSQSKIDYNKLEQIIGKKINQSVKVKIDSLYNLINRLDNNYSKNYEGLKESIENLSQEIDDIHTFNRVLDDRVTNLFDLYKLLGRKVSGKKEKSLTPKEEKIALDSLKYSFDLGVGYDLGKEPYNGSLSLRLVKEGDFIFGAKVGYGEQSTEHPDRVILTSTNPVTGFRGEGVERNKERSIRNYYGIEVGYNLGPISVLLNGGLEVTNLTTNKQVEEYIINRINSVVASNKDNYSNSKKTKKFIPGFGFDCNLKQVNIGARVNLRNGKLEPQFILHYNLGK